MSQPIKGGTYVRMFFMVLSSDHITGATGKTVVVNISKAGGVFAAAAGAVAEIGAGGTGPAGWYKVSFTAADLNTAGDLAVHCTEASCDPTDFVDQVIDPAAANTGVNVTQIGGQAVTCAAPVAVLASVGTAATSTAQTGDSFAVVKSGGTGDNAAIKTKTDYLPSATAGAATGIAIVGSVMGKSPATLAAADVSGNLPVDVKAITVGVDFNAAMKTSLNAATPASVVGAVGSVTADVGVTQAGADKVWSTATRALTDKSGFALSAAGVQAIWDALTSALITVGSVGKKLADWVIGTAQTGDSYARLGAPTGASISADVVAVKGDTTSIKTQTDKMAFTVANKIDANTTYIAGAVVNTATAQIGTNVVSQANIDFGALQKASLNAATPASVGSVTGAVASVTGNVGGSVASVTADVGITQAGADKVWGTVTRALTDKAGFALAVAPPTAAENATAVWGAGTKALTDKAGFSLAVDQSGVTVGTVNALGAQAKTDVKAEVDTSLGTDALVELSAPPPATPTIKQVLTFVAMAMRNAIKATDTQLTIPNDAGTVIAKSTLTDDGTTFTRDKFVAGP